MLTETWSGTKVIPLSKVLATARQASKECERRDRKGLYRLAREGKIKEFTGISDAYGAPDNPELRLDTEHVDPDHCAHQVLLKLKGLGLIGTSH